MPETMTKSRLLQQMCMQCVFQDKMLSTCALRRYACDEYICAAQPWIKSRGVGRKKLSIQLHRGVSRYLVFN